MTRSILVSVLCVLLLLLGSVCVSPAAEGGGYKVIVNSGNGVTRLSKAELSKFFMKKEARWRDGTTVVPVDQKVDAAVRVAFSRAIHGKSARAVKSYWQQQIFSGRGVPPVEKGSDAAVLEYVRNNAGAIGYISELASAAGVTVLEVTD